MAGGDDDAVRDRRDDQAAPHDGLEVALEEAPTLDEETRATDHMDEEGFDDVALQEEVVEAGGVPDARQDCQELDPISVTLRLTPTATVSNLSLRQTRKTCLTLCHVLMIPMIQ